MDNGDPKSARYDSDKDMANPLLIFIALSLAMLLAILEADVHRDALSTIGMVNSSEGINPSFVGP